MPTTPSADPSQKALLEDLKTLAQSDATTTGNQIAMLNEQIAKYQHGKDLFITRYNYWDQYVQAYMLERSFIDGKFQATPLVQADYDSFMNQTGRLFEATAALPLRLSPKRIAEFDAGDLTYVATNDEAVALTKEAASRADLVTGISSAFPNSWVTTSTLTPASTTLTIQRSSDASFPTNVRIILNGGGLSAICLVTAATFLSGPGGLGHESDPYVYRLTVTPQDVTFTNVPSGASVLASELFNNTERTNKTASIPSLQPVLNNLIAIYNARITAWKNLLQNQRNAIVTQTKEDLPDNTYISNQLQALNQLIAYLVTTDVSNSALTAMQNLNATRTSAAPARVAATLVRLQSGSSGGFDQRWNYSDRLYNLSDGSFATIKILTAQRDQLASQQSNSNARAAKFASENF